MLYWSCKHNERLTMTHTIEISQILQTGTQGWSGEKRHLVVSELKDDKAYNGHIACGSGNPFTGARGLTGAKQEVPTQEVVTCKKCQKVLTRFEADSHYDKNTGERVYTYTYSD